MITQKELKKLLTYDPDTGIFINNTNRSPNALKGTIAGSVDSGYIRIYVKGKSYKAHRLAWLYMYGSMPIGHIDHINHNGLDNRIENLRDVDEQDNYKNQTLRATNKSGVIGVSWYKLTNRWVAHISVDGNKIHLGYFVNFHEAVNARKNAEVLYNYHENHGKGE